VVETMTLTHVALRWIHISMGLVGILSGAAALVFRKGSRPHQLVGHVFFVSMLIMASMGATLAMTYSPNRGNVMGGGLTFYMVATAWAKFLLEHVSTMLHRPSFVCALTCDETDGRWTAARRRRVPLRWAVVLRPRPADDAPTGRPFEHRKCE